LHRQPCQFARFFLVDIGDAPRGRFGLDWPVVRFGLRIGWNNPDLGLELANLRHNCGNGSHAEVPSRRLRRDTMFARVILHAREGPVKGQDFVLENGTDCVLGRSADCSVQFADPFAVVSRHHCRIKVFAPTVHIQDLGSRNGSYVNGKMIGQRRKEQMFPEALLEEQAEYSLWQGDTLRVGDTIHQVELDPPPPCAEAEAREQQKLWSGACAVCR
jgi:hypothetical protein